MDDKWLMVSNCE